MFEHKRSTRLVACVASSRVALFARVSRPARRQDLLPAQGSPNSSEEELEARLEEIWEAPRTLFGWFGTVDHKRIGMRYLVTAMAFLVIGGVEALVMRVQLAGPERDVLSPEAYGQYFTMHGATMILWYAAPVLSGFGNYLVPLLIGSRDMSFPRLNAFSYWAFLLSARRRTPAGSRTFPSAATATIPRTTSTSMRWP